MRPPPPGPGDEVEDPDADADLEVQRGEGSAAGKEGLGPVAGHRYSLWKFDPVRRRESRLLRALRFELKELRGVDARGAGDGDRGGVTEESNQRTNRILHLNDLLHGRALASLTLYEEWWARFENFVLAMWAHDHSHQDWCIVAAWGGKHSAEDPTKWDIKPNPAFERMISSDTLECYMRYLTNPKTETMILGGGEHETTVLCRGVSFPTADMALKAITWMVKNLSSDPSTPNGRAFLKQDFSDIPAVTLLMNHMRQNHREQSSPYFDIEDGLPLIRKCIFDDEQGPFADNPLLQWYVWFIVLYMVRTGSRAGDIGLNVDSNTNHSPCWTSVRVPNEEGGWMRSGLVPFPCKVEYVIPSYKGRGRHVFPQHVRILTNRTERGFGNYCLVYAMTMFSMVSGIAQYVKAMEKGERRPVHFVPFCPRYDADLRTLDYTRTAPTTWIQHQIKLVLQHHMCKRLCSRPSGEPAQATPHCLRAVAIMTLLRCGVSEVFARQSCRWSDAVRSFSAYCLRPRRWLRTEGQDSAGPDPIWTFWVFTNIYVDRAPGYTRPPGVDTKLGELQKSLQSRKRRKIAEPAAVSQASE